MPDVQWKIRPDHEQWMTDGETTERILARSEDSAGTINIEWTRRCLSRVQNLRQKLHSHFVGLEAGPAGHLLDWALACLIARENLLLIGPPGVAKTEVAELIFRSLGLQTPAIEDVPRIDFEHDDLSEIWRKREKDERKKQKYFRYLLSRYTQPEELFGPIEIDYLRRGMLVRVNFGLLTSPGVRGAFLDEIFKGSSSILNALLTLVLEREYFNWGGMRKSDLVMLIGASNELPGGFAGGHSGVGSSGEDFSLLYAFLDRFPLRISMPNVSGSSTRDAGDSLLARATRLAIQREAIRFTTYDFVDSAAEKLPSINDTLLLGRAMLESFLPGGSNRLFDQAKLDAFSRAFYNLGADLRNNGTNLRTNAPVSWTISPRKMKALYKIALAHALIVDENFASFQRKPARVNGPNPRDLYVFDFIWDTEMMREHLHEFVQTAVEGA